MAAYAFDSKDIVLNIAGVTIGGFGENKVTITREDDVTTKTSGVDGDNMFAFNNNTGGTLGFDLKYGTDYDLYMDNLVSLKQLVPVAFLHKKSLKKLVTVGAVMTQPDITLGSEPDDRAWVLNLDNVELSIKGQVGELIGAADIFTPSTSATSTITV